MELWASRADIYRLWSSCHAINTSKNIDLKRPICLFPLVVIFFMVMGSDLRYQVSIPGICNFEKPNLSCFVGMLNVKLNRKSLYLGFYQAGWFIFGTFTLSALRNQMATKHVVDFQRNKILKIYYSGQHKCIVNCFTQAVFFTS